MIHSSRYWDGYGDAYDKRLPNRHHNDDDYTIGHKHGARRRKSESSSRIGIAEHLERVPCGPHDMMRDIRTTAEVTNTVSLVNRTMARGQYQMRRPMFHRDPMRELLRHEQQQQQRD